ncbi:MAG: cell wall metabolism sensor histidine kinase WalK, partial [Oscillospiraceae bacterium]|nr:cell wall metabolism sensor histidine kinase WalK [Oscillospiraceae bacterium]
MTAEKRGKRWSSIRWKIVFMYVLLVFIATTIIGVFIMSQLEAYYNRSVTSNLRKTISETTLLTSLEVYDGLAAHQSEIQTNVDAWARMLQNEVFVVDSQWKIIAATNEYKGGSAHGLLDETLIFRVLRGDFEEYGENDAVYLRDDKDIPVKNTAFPIMNADGKIQGV